MDLMDLFFIRAIGQTHREHLKMETVFIPQCNERAHVAVQEERHPGKVKARRGGRIAEEGMGGGII
jgi:hypothetical protein